MGTGSSIKSDNFLEMFASLALSKVSEGIPTFSAPHFLSQMQAAGASQSPGSILSPSPAQVTQTNSKVQSPALSERVHFHMETEK